MNPNLKKVIEVSKKKSRIIIGLMSGTSVDGLDVALCEFTGAGSESKVKLNKFITYPYDKTTKDRIRSVMSLRDVDLKEVTLLNADIGVLHGKLILKALNEWGVKTSDVDLIASHGQTIYHIPKENSSICKNKSYTLQIGDADHIAAVTGIVTLSDFRQKNVAHGGQGAPLVLYGDYLLYSSGDENRVLLNMGGIANFTFLKKGKYETALATDTGPGNTLLDAFSRKLFNEECDLNGKFSGKGKANKNLLNLLLEDDFFHQDLPKTTGPELFNVQYVQNRINELKLNISDFDLMATLLELSIKSICLEIKKVANNEELSFYLSGGGASHPLLVKGIRKSFPNAKFKNFEEIAFNGDAKEAVLFASLANETIAGDMSKVNLAYVPNVNLGKISFPN